MELLAAKTAVDKEWCKLQKIPSLDCLSFHRENKFFLYAHRNGWTKSHLGSPPLIDQVDLQCTERESKTERDPQYNFRKAV